MAATDTIDTTLDWLERQKEAALQRAMGATGQERETAIDDGAKAGHAASLIRRAYR